ncbi:hypothetical protein C0966_08210 [Bacillus methanolicus]|uniref:LppM family (lipo)protein n=1 Tax=Bacillus methanolicus TaxID=1471 RepID=UPI002A38B38D|nr:hypothetical protein [Bacillus methanolicus]
MISIFIFTILLTGCVKFNTTLKIHSDGSSDLTIIYGIDKQVASIDGTMTKSMEETKKEAETRGFKVVNFKDDKYIGLKLEKHFDTYEDLAKKEDMRLFDLKVEEKKGFFKNKYSISGNFDFTGMMDDAGTEEFDQQMASSMMSQMDLNFTLVLPTKVGENNASEIKDDGKTLVWEFLPNVNNDIEFEFEKVNYLNIGLLIFGGIILAVVIFVFIKRKRKSAGISIEQ